MVCVDGQDKDVNDKECFLAVTLCHRLFQNAIGQSTTFFDRGVDAAKCDEAGIFHLNEIVEQDDLSVICIQAPFTADATGSEGYDKLKDFAELQKQARRTCMVADARHTTRWSSCKPSLCGGDLAFQCSDKLMAESSMFKGPIDGIEGSRDEVVPDDTEAFDDEQDLPDKIPLPGNPVSEQQRRQKWK